MKPEQTFMISIVVMLLIVGTIGLMAMFGSRGQIYSVFMYLIVIGAFLFMVLHKREKKTDTKEQEEKVKIKIDDH